MTKISGRNNLSSENPALPENEHKPSESVKPTRIPRPENQKLEHRRIDQRDIRPYYEQTDRVRITVSVPDCYKNTGQIPKYLSIPASADKGDLETFLRDKLKLQETNHLQLTLLHNGQPTSFSAFGEGGTYELAVMVDPELESRFQGTVSDIDYQEVDDYQPTPFSSLYESHGVDGLTGQIENVASGKCPAGVIDISSFWDISLEVVQGCKELEVRLIPSPCGPGYQLVFWRKNSAAARKAVENYIGRQKLLTKQAKAEYYLGTNKEQVAANHKILQLHARKLLVGGDDSWSEEIHRLTRQEAVQQRNQESCSSISKKKRSEVFGERVEARIYLGKSVRNTIDHHVKVLSRQGFRFPKNSRLLKSELPSEVETLLGPWQKRLSLPIPKTRYGIEFQVKELIKQAQAIERNFNNWKMTRNKVSFSEMKVINEIGNTLKLEYKLLLQLLNDPGNLECALNGMTWNQAMEFKRLGYSFQSNITKVSTLNDLYLDKKHPPKALGSGASHTVYLIQYILPDGNIEQRIFKPVTTRDGSMWKDIIDDGHYLNPNCPFFTFRNMAAEHASNALGCHSLVPDVEFVEHDNQLGLSMTVASGKVAYEASVLGELDTMPRDLFWNMCCQINRLEWLDALCAQPDRHQNNYLVDLVTGNITGIDNDLCFSPNPEILIASKDESLRHSFSAGARTGFPLVVDRFFLDQLRALDIDTLVVDLEPLLRQEELVALKARYHKLLQHAEGLELRDYCIDDWTTWTDPVFGYKADKYQARVEDEPESFLFPFEFQAELVRKRDYRKALQGVNSTDKEREILQNERRCLKNIANSLKIAGEHSYLGTLMMMVSRPSK